MLLGTLPKESHCRIDYVLVERCHDQIELASVFKLLEEVQADKLLLSDISDEARYVHNSSLFLSCPPPMN